MTTSDWTTIASAIKQLSNAPSWLNELGSLCYEDVLRLPKVDNAPKGQIARPIVKLTAIPQDYLDFLEEQIRLGARGPEWNDVLRLRRNALKPFVGKEVLTISIYRFPDTVGLYLEPKTGRLLNAEILA